MPKTLETNLTQGKIVPSQIAHIVFRTPQFAKMRAFYLDLLDGDVRFENDLISFICYDEEHHRIVIANDPGAAPRNPALAGVEHYALTFPDLPSLLGKYRRMKAKGFEPAWCINHGFTTSIYYQDPDNNLVETQFDNMSNDCAQEFISSPYFAINPIGVDFDPEILIAKMESGATLPELTRLGSALPDLAAPHRVPPGIPPYDWRGAMLPS